ncbi:MAG: hypothetical protein CMG21_02840 [Candidatus Marinimicrobia bacterium]|nr:hypothetical protein [Candidatus Neomarinimicrobiota bacterium]
MFVIITYTNNKKLIKFNTIKLVKSNFINEETLFNEINYNLDSIKFYSNYDINNFKQKIYNLEKNGIIQDVKLSYSLPNKILVNIKSNKPIYIIETKVNKFILDENGAIYNTKFFTSNPSIPKVDLIFLADKFYEDWNTKQQGLDLKNLINNINKNKSNEQYLLNAFEILHWFENNYLYTHVNSVSIKEQTIDIFLDQTKISFSKDYKEIKNQINKINQIVNNRDLLDSLNINDLTDLKEIKLFFNNQIVIKS